jgi:hypothetical protein
VSYWTKLGDVRVHVACREPRSAETQRALDELIAAAARRLKSPDREQHEPVSTPLSLGGRG